MSCSLKSWLYMTERIGGMFWIQMTSFECCVVLIPKRNSQRQMGFVIRKCDMANALWYMQVSYFLTYCTRQMDSLFEC